MAGTTKNNKPKGKGSKQTAALDNLQGEDFDVDQSGWTIVGNAAGSDSKAKQSAEKKSEKKDAATSSSKGKSKAQTTAAAHDTGFSVTDENIWSVMDEVGETEFVLKPKVKPDNSKQKKVGGATTPAAKKKVTPVGKYTEKQLKKQSEQRNKQLEEEQQRQLEELEQQFLKQQLKEKKGSNQAQSQKATADKDKEKQKQKASSEGQSKPQKEKPRTAEDICKNVGTALEDYVYAADERFPETPDIKLRDVAGFFGTVFKQCDSAKFNKSFEDKLRKDFAGTIAYPADLLGQATQETIVSWAAKIDENLVIDEIKFLLNTLYNEGIVNQGEGVGIRLFLQLLVRAHAKVFLQNYTVIKPMAPKSTFLWMFAQTTEHQPEMAMRVWISQILPLLDSPLSEEEVSVYFSITGKILQTIKQLNNQENKTIDGDLLVKLLKLAFSDSQYKDRLRGIYDSVVKGNVFSSANAPNKYFEKLLALADCEQVDMRNEVLSRLYSMVKSEPEKSYKVWGDKHINYLPQSGYFSTFIEKNISKNKDPQFPREGLKAVVRNIIIRNKELLAQDQDGAKKGKKKKTPAITWTKEQIAASNVRIKKLEKQLIGWGPTVCKVMTFLVPISAMTAAGLVCYLNCSAYPICRSLKLC